MPPRNKVHSSSFSSSRILRAPAVRINFQDARIVDDIETPPATSDIALPFHRDEVSHVAVDIGGSLAKVVYFTRDRDGGGGRLTFTKFETERIDECISFLQCLIDNHKNGDNTSKSWTGPSERVVPDMCIMATGGGSFKFYELMKKELNVEVIKEDEMECLIVGLDFFISEIPLEVITYTDEDPMQFCDNRGNTYPYLLVNIGSGVSMIKVSERGKYERIGGSSLGGGTLWGLLSVLTGAKSFDEMLELSEQGDNSAVDMLVGDIYGQGQDYSRIGLKSTAIASTFGKVFRRKSDVSSLAAEDMSRSLLYAISNNIGQIAYLHAQRHQLENIYFGGSFIRGHTATMHTLSYAIRFWSKNTYKAYFLRHEGYLGAVGAFLKHEPPEWKGRYSRSNSHVEARE